MNLLEHYIEKIHSETDITDDFTRKAGYPPKERMFTVEMDINCYGVKERVKKVFFESELKSAKADGYYLA